MLQDVHVNTDFNQLREKLRIQLPELRVHHGGDAIPVKPRIELPPVIKLCNYIERHNVRLIDVFSTADPDRRMRVSRSQFVEGVRVSGVFTYWTGPTLQRKLSEFYQNYVQFIKDAILVNTCN